MCLRYQTRLRSVKTSLLVRWSSTSARSTVICTRAHACVQRPPGSQTRICLAAPHPRSHRPAIQWTYRQISRHAAVLKFADSRAAPLYVLSSVSHLDRFATLQGLSVLHYHPIPGMRPKGASTLVTWHIIHPLSGARSDGWLCPSARIGNANLCGTTSWSASQLR
jgi:hypothetical protein